MYENFRFSLHDVADFSSHGVIFVADYCSFSLQVLFVADFRTLQFARRYFYRGFQFARRYFYRKFFRVSVYTFLLLRIFRMLQFARVIFIADFSLHDAIFVAGFLEFQFARSFCCRLFGRFGLHNVTLVMDVSVCMTFRAATCIFTIIDDALTQRDGMDWGDLNEKTGKAEKYRTHCTEGASPGYRREH